MVEMLLRKIVHGMAVEAAGVEVEAHHQGVVQRRHLDSALIEHDPVELEIVADLQRRRVFEQWFELPQQQLGRQLDGRTEERRVGKEWVSTSRTRGSEVK